MEQYFSTARVHETDKLNITTMYLTGDTKHWWRTRNADDVSAGRSEINKWDKLVKESSQQRLLACKRQVEETEVGGFGATLY